MGLQNTETPKSKTGFGIHPEQYLQAIFSKTEKQSKTLKPYLTKPSLAFSLSSWADTYSGQGTSLSISILILVVFKSSFKYHQHYMNSQWDLISTVRCSIPHPARRPSNPPPNTVLHPSIVDLFLYLNSYSSGKARHKQAFSLHSNKSLSLSVMTSFIELARACIATPHHTSGLIIVLDHLFAHFDSIWTFCTSWLNLNRFPSRRDNRC